MPLYVNDDEVDALAKQLQALLKAPSKTAAVRTALQNEIVRARKAVPLRERLAGAKTLVHRMGENDPDFDQKRFTDDLWGR